MEFKKTGTQCPNCGHIVIYERDKLSEYSISPRGDKIGWDDELYTLCYNKDCKLEFLVDTKVGSEEQKFIDYCLAPFDKKWWRVDRFIAGGSLSERSVIGADFLIHHLEGGSVWVEFKRHNKFSFTHSQHYRFKTSFDDNAVATRFVGLITVQKRGFKDYNNHVHYWTPAFYRVIPDKSFVLEKRKKGSKFKPKYALNLTGLDKCIRKNVYTLQRNSDESIVPLKPIEKDAILQTPNFSIFNLTKGSLFRKAEYENISNEDAFKIIAMKLRQTVNNRAEDRAWQEKRPYISYEVVKITREEMRPALKQSISKIIQNSHRPLFPQEITNIVGDLPEYSKFCVEDEKNIKFVQEKEKIIPLRTIVKLTMELMLREGVLLRTKAKGDRAYQYYLKGRIPIPLKLASSRYLDYLRQYIMIRLNQSGNHIQKTTPQIKQIVKTFFPTSNPELAKFLQIDYNSLRGTFEKQYRDELIQNGLITIQKKETEYQRGQRPSVMAEFIWLIHLTDRGIAYLLGNGALLFQSYE
jgi:hypothetical protein